MFVDICSTQRNQTASPLLRLPAELRNRIYEFSFDSATLKRDLSPGSAGRHLVECDNPHLVQVCRQIRFETCPFRNDFTYHRLTVRTDSKHIADLVDCVGQTQCAQIVQIDIFQSLAGALEQMIRYARLQGPYTEPWAKYGDKVFPELKRVVVTYPIDLADNSIEIKEALQTLFGKDDLDVHFRAAKYWQTGRQHRARLRGGK
ncbi:hypothetical protein SVAN01_08266 [Stagonosporopsis vannaccii]|nr:hypothetical protein SVAN01_08266 [Stagonosporopsis vannaccii]